uniref:Uncharacterized protein n=1 Tax=Salix viminalis TaxID=40686 RepID=A0A6N2KKZ0_SALVM
METARSDLNFNRNKVFIISQNRVGNQKDPLSNGIGNTRTGTGSQRRPFSNGVVKVVPPPAKPTQMVTSIVPPLTVIFKKSQASTKWR